MKIEKSSERIVSWAVWIAEPGLLGLGTYSGPLQWFDWQM